MEFHSDKNEANEFINILKVQGWDTPLCHHGAEAIIHLVRQAQFLASSYCHLLLDNEDKRELVTCK